VPALRAGVRRAPGRRLVPLRAVGAGIDGERFAMFRRRLTTSSLPARGLVRQVWRASSTPWSVALVGGDIVPPQALSDASQIRDGRGAMVC